MSLIDVFNFEKSPFFEKIRAGFPAERQNTKGLLDCKDDLLFGWDLKSSCVLVINWRSALEKGIETAKYQCLIPKTMQSFEVERISVSQECSLIALIGTDGVAVLDLPKRIGSNGDYLNGKAKIICRCANLDENFFSNNTSMVRQVRWHPYSPNDSHLLVLLSDNTIRVYNHFTLNHVWQVGPFILNKISFDGTINFSDARNISGNVTLPTNIDFGETVVDFEIAPPIKTTTYMDNFNKTTNNTTQLNRSTSINNNTSNNNNSTLCIVEQVIWPIVLLRENGNIYILKTTLKTDNPRLQGPLTITPQAVDNYGADSCAILLIPSLPPTLIIAESTGKLHHALLLETEAAEDSFSEVDSCIDIEQSEWFVHVLETVNLELGLLANEKSSSANDAYQCAIHLKHDYINETRYFAYHNAGLHVISVNFINGLRDYCINQDVAADTAFLNIPSHAEYLLCTRVKTGGLLNAIIGFVQLHVPSAILSLNGSGQIVSLKLIIDVNYLDSNFIKQMHTNDSMTQQLQQQQQQQQQKAHISVGSANLVDTNFIDRIKNILTRTVTQPILSLDKNSQLEPMECLELLCQAIDVLDTQYNTRHKMAQKEINKYVHAISLRKQQQIEEIQQLEEERVIISDNAHRLAERYEELCDQQERLTKYCQEMVRKTSTCLPYNLVEKSDFRKNIERINKITQRLQKQLESVNEMMKRQNYQISKYNEKRNKKTTELPRIVQHENLMKATIIQHTAEIGKQMQEIRRFEKAANF